MMGCFSSGLMTNSFTHDLDALLNIATGVVLPDDVAQNLVCSTEKGQEQIPGGGVLPEKFGRGVRSASQNPYPIYDLT